MKLRRVSALVRVFGDDALPGRGGRLSPDGDETGGEEQPLRTATGFVVGTAVCGLFWGAIAAIWYAL